MCRFCVPKYIRTHLRNMRNKYILLEKYFKVLAVSLNRLVGNSLRILLRLHLKHMKHMHLKHMFWCDF